MAGGARGAAGVVLVTTKRGARGSSQVTLDASYGTQVAGREIAMLNATQFATLVNEARANAGQTSEPAPAVEPHQNGFGLVVGVVGSGEHLDTAHAERAAQRFVSCIPGTVLQVTGFDRDAHGFVWNRQVRAQPGDRFCLGRRFRAQSVVDGGCDNPPR